MERGDLKSPLFYFNMKRSLIIFSVVISFFSCTQKKQEIQVNTAIFEHLSSTTTNINFNNKIKNSPELNILNYLYFYNGAGVAVADFNNDKLQDIYFTSNLGEDKLYLNQGNLTFKDITSLANLNNNKGWTTGVTTVDINNDGLLDIYVSKIGDYKHLKGHNLLYINKGVDENNIPTFEEASKHYGLDIVSFATQSVFFDFDKDNDLDLYVLNHSVYPNRTYGRGSKRKTVDEYSGDRLYENVNGKFVDISSTSGIFQGNIGYGLGVSVSDVNNDGYPDIYIGNDFFENDYLYINNGNKTFTEVISENSKKLGHTSHFSMGNDIADLNNDGLIDIVSVDMLPEDLKTYNTSAKEYGYQTYSNYLRNGYAPQFMQNTMHINRGDNVFSEIAHQSGIAATEWSWTPLLADFDNDGYNDVFVTNGILGATNDMDFINFIANKEIQQKIEFGLQESDLHFIDKLPKKKTQNYFFKNNQKLTFENMSNHWISNPKTSYSNGATYADLDNDGDLDIVVNNINEEAFVIKNNTTEKLKTNYITVDFIGPKTNTNGLGTKVTIYNKALLQTKENYTTKGYLSSKPPLLHFGVTSKKIDSLRVIWSDGKMQVLKDITANNTITLNYKDASNFYKKKADQVQKPISLSIKHKDNSPIEFNRNPLIPYSLSNLGAKVSVTDVNNDGLEDIFVSGAKGQTSQLYTQNNNGEFNSIQEDTFKIDQINEDVSHDFGDINNDGFKDLIVVSGGNEFKKGKAIQPRLYINQKGTFVKTTTNLPTMNSNASKVQFIDFDNDNDLDLCITSNANNLLFGHSSVQYLLENDGTGNYNDVTEKIAPKFREIGSVSDFIYEDVNNDTIKDLIVVGHWMPVSIFINNNGKFELQDDTLKNTNGWWNTIKSGDFDNDGDLDLVVGNWGLNSRLNASTKEPLRLYSYDFDNNGNIEPIVTYYYQGVETTFASKEEITKQLPHLNKEFLTHGKFADASIKDIFKKESLKKAYKKEVYELATCYFENIGNGQYKKVVLPYFAQISQVNDILVEDLNNDSYKDLIFVGNNYEISTQLSKLGASHGEIFLNDKKGNFNYYPKKNLGVLGAVQHLNNIKIKDKEYLLIARNNDSLQIIAKDQLIIKNSN